MNSYSDGAPMEACGDVTDIVPNHNSSALSDGVPFSVTLTDFEEDVYIPETMYYCKCYCTVVICIHSSDCFQCTCSQTIILATVSRGL